MPTTVIMKTSRPDGAGGTYKQGSTYTIADDLAAYFLSIGAAKRTSTCSEQTGATVSGDSAGRFPSAPSLDKSVPLTATLSDGEVVNTSLDSGQTVFPKYRKFTGFVPCIVASLVAGATYGQSGTLVTVAATGHGLTAALNGRAVYWPGSAAIAAGFYPNYQYVDANTFTFSNPASQTVASGSSLTPTLPFTSPVKIASRKIYGNSISATGKIEVDFTSVADNSAGIKSLQIKLSGSQCGLHQVGSTPNISGRISIYADGSTSKQIAVAGADGNASSTTYQTAIDLNVDQTLEVFLQTTGASQFRSVVSLLAREVA